MLSRKWAIIRFIAVLAAGIWIVCVYLFCPNNILQWVLSVLSCVIALLWHLLTMECPHCGHLGTVRCNPFSETCGRCRNCGKIVYWKEHMKDEDIENI